VTGEEWRLETGKKETGKKETGRKGGMIEWMNDKFYHRISLSFNNSTVQQFNSLTIQP
jgi:hypothetical protein